MNIANSIVNKVSTLRDGSVKIELITRELSPEQMAELFYSVNKEILSVDIPDESEQKSDSQRLRAVLFLRWKNDPELQIKFSTFALFKSSYFERLIEKNKELIKN